ncbi:MAG: hypothetical protein AB8B55_04250 [Mariniblastus sp.]
MTNWKTVVTELSDSTHHYKILDTNDRVLTFSQVIRLWAAPNATDGSAFRKFITQTICDSSFGSFKWETPVVDADRIDREFEFVILNSRGLDRRENDGPFSEQFQSASADDLAIEFENLGRNAILVVPTPSKSSGVNHCHLASFLRTSDAEQSDQLWRKVGDAMAKRISQKPVWLSTAGGGVAWLHLRLDDRPKYYGYSPFQSK